MRRFSQLILTLLCICLLATSVYASSVTSVQSVSHVSANGACQISMSVVIRLDSPAENVTFPLPKNARDVTANGASVRTYASSIDPDVILADLNFLDGMMGDTPVNVNFTLSDVTTTVDKKLYINIPLVSSFDFPVQSLSFIITVPGELTGKPKFSSGYLQTGIESIISCSVGGNMITGITTAPLQDRETVTLVMEVPEEMFPGKLIILREGNPEVVPMAICAGLALLYWILMMRCFPLLRQKRSSPLEGVTAGEMGSHLTAAGADLTMMSFTWAQLGYLHIHPEKNGRVLLIKRMEMGNERTDFENRCFAALFSKGNIVDATSGAYARLHLRVEETVAGVREMYSRRAGNIYLFRALACGISLFSGICFANNFTTHRVLSTVLAICLAIVGAVTAWAAQGGMYRVHIRGKIPLYISLICSVLWLAVGIAAGQWLIGLLAVLAQLLAGLAAAYGGRRSDLGYQQAAQILGLRKYLKSITRPDLNRIMENNPDYFFEMLPYAIALGVDTPFARAYGKMKVGHCPYMTARENQKRTAAEWAILLRKTADKMDALQRRMELEKFIPVSLSLPVITLRPRRR